MIGRFVFEDAMLHLILGRSGTGKTGRAVEIAEQHTTQGRKVLFLVPEQFTFETEKLILRRLGPGSCLNIEILSFTRLAYRVFGEYGGVACRYIDECGRYAVMGRALKQIGGELTVYRRQAASAPFIKLMVDSVSEYKTCGVTPEALAAAAGKINAGNLKSKLHDISIILETYDAMLRERFTDSLDDLERLCHAVDACPFFEDKTVIIDSFYGFTAPEIDVIERIIRQAPDVYITLCADSLEDAEHGVGLFSHIKKTANSLIRAAGKNGADVASPVLLSEEKRSRQKCLKALENNLFRHSGLIDPGPADSIHIFAARDVYTEVQAIASEIKSLAAKTACRYADIAVIVGSLESYRPVFESVFRKYGIPVYIDAKKPVSSHPLMVAVTSFLELCGGKFTHETIFRYLKTGLAGFTTEEISVLENYSLMWNIRGREAWGTEWKENPSGMGREFDENAKEELAAVNSLRLRVIKTVDGFSEKLKPEPTGEDLAACLYESFCSAGVPEKIDEIRGRLLAAGELDLSDEYERIWELFLHILDQIALAFGGRSMETAEFTKLFALVVKNDEYGHIQPSLDGVTVGSYERIRAGEKRFVFAAGLADGIFPSASRNAGVFSDAEILRLEQCGLEFLKSAQEKSVEERFFAYKALVSASDELFLFYPKSDQTGKTLRPSYYLGAVKAAVPACVETDALADGLDAVQNISSAFEALAENFMNSGPLSSALRRYFNENGGTEYRAKMEALKVVSRKADFKIANPALPGKLFGQNLHISPSMAENHRQCRFAFFCRYGVRALPREKAEMTAPQTGTLIHYVLERLLSENTSTDKNGALLFDAGTKEKIRGLLDEYADRFLGGLENKPERFRYLYSRLADSITEIVLHLSQELSQSEFRPADFELEISEKGAVKPLAVPMPDGGRLFIEGKVDRVDILKKGKNTYLRVIDYKTGVKQFSLSDVMNGLNMQMLIYLFVLCRNGGERYGAENGKPIPAGVLYMPARRADVKGDRNAPPDSVETEKAKKMRMNGLILDRPEAVVGMERDGAGIFIPAKFQVEKDETGNTVSCRFDAASSIASLEKLGLLENHVENILRRMGKMLNSGDISAIPINGSGYDPCRYCSYSSVCGHEPSDKVERIADFDKKQVWERLEEEYGSGPKNES